MSASWKEAGNRLLPSSLVDRLTGRRFEQTGTELFRLSTRPAKRTTGVFVGIRIEASKVLAVASADGSSWSELASFPRSQFAGLPKLARIGKMDLHGLAKDYSGEPGAPGHCHITQFSLDSSRVFDFDVNANQASAKEYAVTPGTGFVSCRIDKMTDQGMSWGPALALVWEEGKRFVLVGVRDGTSVFNVSSQAGERIVGQSVEAQPDFDLKASDFRLASPPAVIRFAGAADGVRIADRIGGAAIEADFNHPGGLRAHWRAELRDGSNYVHQSVTLSCSGAPIPLYAMEFADIRAPGLKTIGSVPGCPVAGSGMFFGVELPGTQGYVGPHGCRISFACRLTVSSTQSYSFGSVAGVAPEGQLRRAFLYYVERERARPSSPFLHYNCWYDLGFSVDKEKMLDAVTQFHQEMEVKRGVPVKAYLVDDGWDDPSKGLWTENLEKFPGGFSALRAEMAKLNAHLAIWISPLGGYGGAEERTADARKMGLIPADSGLDLAYPAYKEWFEKRCLTLMQEDGVVGFKWDRAGDGVSPHFMALLDIAHRLRQVNPNLFINVTVGTWPSPFWLNHIDSTWRNGSADVGWAGVGDLREQWITYRDGWGKKLFVDRSPLYPLNSVMLHGVVEGRNFQGERVAKAGPHLRHEARSYFANGSSLQELYLTPSMMTPDAWDDVAGAAKWAASNADVLVDSHWVGGDPLQQQVYGFASWNPHKATLMLRNPSDHSATIELDAQTVFELPAGAARSYSLKSPYADQRVGTLELSAAKKSSVTLQPFEVLVFDARRFAKGVWSQTARRQLTNMSTEND